jgi:phosphopantothenoylcysteine decarboxylase/phosphopantothenate--cysteine ligase
MNVLLCVSASISIYKACDVARALIKNGNIVNIVLSESASKMISPIVFEGLTGNQCYIHDTGKMEHIYLSRWADILLLCPATASTIGKIANGIGGTLLLDIFLAKKPDLRTIIAPAMNTQMWENVFVGENLKKLKANGFEIIEPESGILACGEEGQGKLASVEEIVNFIAPKNGKKVLITAGGTIEEIDSVRFMTNHSSGKQALEIALEFWKNGYDVTIVKGKTDVEFPKYLNVINVKSANDMLKCVMENVKNVDAFISVAAVADFGFSKTEGKIKKENLTELKLIKNPDILATVGNSELRPQCVVGFAAESENLVENARQKLIKKNCDFVVANNLVFGAEETSGYIVTKTEAKPFNCTKKELAKMVVGLVK